MRRGRTCPSCLLQIELLLFITLGSLTTVSTFIAELYALPPVPYLYVYAIVTVGITQAALIPINGLFMWP